MKTLLIFWGFVVCMTTMSLKEVYGQNQDYGSGITFLVDSNFKETNSKYCSFATIRFQDAQDTTRVPYGPSKTISRPDFSLLYWEENPRNPNPRINAAFDFRVTPSGTFHHEWGEPQGHFGVTRKSNIQMEVEADWPPVRHAQTRPHLGGGQSVTTDTFGTTSFHFEQDWPKADSFYLSLDLPYLIPGSDSVVVADTTELEHAFFVLTDGNNNFKHEIDLTQGVSLSETDPRQYSSGVQDVVRWLHPNAADWFEDEDGTVSGRPGSIVVAFSMKGASEVHFRELFSGALLGRLTRDGYQLMVDEGFDDNVLGFSNQHGLTIPNKQVSEGVFEMHVYNNGGQNDTARGEALQIEVRWGTSTNPEGKPFAYGVLCRNASENVIAFQLGNAEFFNEFAFVNWGRISNENKFLWYNCETGDTLAMASFGDPKRESFNAVFTEEVYGMEDYAPRVHVERIGDQLYLVATGNSSGPFKWPDGSVTEDNKILLPSTDAADLGVCERFGNQNGWICSPTPDQDQIDVVVGISEIAISDVAVFPNPTSRNFRIETTVPGDITISSVANMIAKQMKWDGYSSISLEEMPSGMYVGTLINSDGVQTFKIMLTK